MELFEVINMASKANYRFFEGYFKISYFWCVIVKKEQENETEYIQIGKRNTEHGDVFDYAVTSGGKKIIDEKGILSEKLQVYFYSQLMKETAPRITKDQRN